MSAEQKAQQDFCRETLNNVQSLIGRMDLKAGVVLTVASLLSAAIYALGSCFFSKGVYPQYLCRFLVGAVIIYFLLFAYILWEATRVFIARTAMMGNYSGALQMLYPLLILKTFKSDKDYAEKSANLSHQDILADYANQIMECSNIYRLKHQHVNRAIRTLAVLLIPWFIFVVFVTLHLFLSVPSAA